VPARLGADPRRSLNEPNLDRGTSKIALHAMLDMLGKNRFTPSDCICFIVGMNGATMDFFAVSLPDDFIKLHPRGLPSVHAALIPPKFFVFVRFDLLPLPKCKDDKCQRRQEDDCANPLGHHGTRLNLR
jgi:hypothetical protein